MKKLYAALAGAMLLAACSPAQVAKLDAATAKLNSYVTIGCQLDGKWVPLGQDVMPQIAAATGVVLTAAGQPVAGASVAGFLVAANQVDKLLVHPEVVAVCTALVGAGATVTAKPAA